MMTRPTAGPVPTAARFPDRTATRRAGQGFGQDSSTAAVAPADGRSAAAALVQTSGWPFDPPAAMTVHLLPMNRHRQGTEGQRKT